MDNFEDVPPSERERERRRDRDASAKRRAGMQTGLAKQFKQVLDVQRRRAEEAERSLAEREQSERQREARARTESGRKGTERRAGGRGRKKDARDPPSMIEADVGAPPEESS